MILTGLASLAMLSVAWAGPTRPTLTTCVSILLTAQSAAAIDATSFINNSAFIDRVIRFNMPFATANTVYYTNYGVLGARCGLPV